MHDTSLRKPSAIYIFEGDIKMTEFENEMRKGRKEKNLTQRDVAEKVGVPVQTISKLESGIYVPLEKDEIFRIAGVIGSDELLFFSMYENTFHQEMYSKSKDELAEIVSYINGSSLKDMGSEY